MRPRMVDWSIFIVVMFEFVTGLVSLVSGQPSQGWVFVIHGVGGLSLLVLLLWKFRRVYPRVMKLRVWDAGTIVSILAALLVLAALGTGIYWAFGGDFKLWWWGGLNIHIFLGLVLIPLYLIHMVVRWKLPSARDVQGRRTLLRFLGLAGFGFLTWQAQQAVNELLETAGDERRFTGSREEGSDQGNGFPVTSWVADDPDPVDAETWELRVQGAVEREVSLDYDGIADAADRKRALLDCTGGWYSVQDWHGIRVGRLLDRAQPTSEARWVRFKSVTGYRWSLPLPEAYDALLATHVGDETLSHSHGFPLRLVAPGRRGFQWVKWVEGVEVLAERDLGQWAVIFTSGYTGPED